MNRKRITHIIFLLAAALAFVCLYRSCYPFWGYAEEEVYTSPEGTNTIIVKYDPAALMCLKKDFYGIKRYGIILAAALWKPSILA